MGCFWGAERKFWEADGVFTTAVGLRRRLHAEPLLRRGVQRPHRPHRSGARRVSTRDHEPRRDAAHLLGGPRPHAGHATGQRRRHAVPLLDLHGVRRAARGGRAVARHLPAHAHRGGYGEITTEIAAAGPFFYAEPYHQQYLAKNPDGYCGLGGTGVSCPTGLDVLGVTVIDRLLRRLRRAASRASRRSCATVPMPIWRRSHRQHPSGG